MGGFGSVFKVKNRIDERIYAIKKIKVGRTGKKYMDRILREVITLSYVTTLLFLTGSLLLLLLLFLLLLFSFFFSFFLVNLLVAFIMSTWCGITRLGTIGTNHLRRMIYSSSQVSLAESPFSGSNL